MTPAEIAAATADRLNKADDDAHKAQVAFASGKFEDYYKAKCEEARKRIDDEYARVSGPPATPGNS